MITNLLKMDIPYTYELCTYMLSKTRRYVDLQYTFSTCNCGIYNYTKLSQCILTTLL